MAFGDKKGPKVAAAVESAPLPVEVGDLVAALRAQRAKFDDAKREVADAQAQLLVLEDKARNLFAEVQRIENALLIAARGGR